MHPRASELIQLLKLEPHPEGGHFVQTFRSSLTVTPSDLRGSRTALTSFISFSFKAASVAGIGSPQTRHGTGTRVTHLSSSQRLLTQASFSFRFSVRFQPAPHRNWLFPQVTGRQRVQAEPTLLWAAQWGPGSNIPISLCSHPYRSTKDRA
jgi:hypothetical protein